MRIHFAVLVVVLVLSACSRREAAPGNDAEAEIVIQQTDSGPWRVSYQFGQAMNEIDLGPSLGGYRAKHWRAIGAEYRIAPRDGRDFIQSTKGKALSEAAFLVEPAKADLRKEYEPFIAMGDGGALLYAGHFMPFLDRGRRLDSRLTVIPAEGGVVSAFGETAPRFENWESPFGHPAFIYVGRRRAVDEGAMHTVIDSSAPDWIQRDVAGFAPLIAAALEDILQRALPAQPNIFLAIGDLGETGRLSYSGDALPGQFQMTLAGEGWKEPTPQSLGVLRRSTAHETAHLWQAAARPKTEAVPAWIHEGGAEALAAEALVKAGYWTEEVRAADLQTARADCTRALQRQSLQRAEAQERWDAVYACGYVINVAAAGPQGVAALWRALIARAAVEGYDEAMFLGLAEERAGADQASQIRGLVRQNNARPDLAIARLFDESPELAGGRAR